MTVEELIVELQSLPGNMEVRCNNNEIVVREYYSPANKKLLTIGPQIDDKENLIKLINSISQFPF